MTDLRLSICIPTYNFGAFIGETLDSIVAQWRPGVEIVVLDGGSTDNTAEVVATRQAHCAALIYHRQPQRGGIDRDMARVVDLAAGRYVWLFSADDIMLPGAIDRIWGELDSGLDLYLCAHQECDLDMRVTKERHHALMIDADQLFDFADQAHRQEFDAAAFTTAAYFSFIGSLVVRREFWLSEPLNEDFVGTCWAHVVRLLTLTKRGMRLKYVVQPLLQRRGDNDSFAGDGIVARAALGIDGYHRIAGHVFGTRSSTAHAIRRAVTREYTLGFLLSVKHACLTRPGEDRRRLAELADRTFGDTGAANALRLAAFRLIPAQLYPALRRGWDCFRRSRRTTQLS